MLKDLLLLINFTSKYYKKKLFFLQILIIISSLIQLLSIFSFGPLILILLDSENIKKFNLSFIKKIIENFSEQDLLLYFIIIIILLFILSNFLSILVSKISLNFGQQIGIKLNNQIFRDIMFREYQYHLNVNSSEIISKITLESARVINSILIPMLLINSRIAIVFFVLLGLMAFNLKATIIAFFFLILSYFIIFFINKNRFITNSNLISHNNRIRQKIISESLGNMRETIMFSAQEFFLKLFNKSNSIISYSIANNQYLSSIPRFIIEIIVFIIIIFFIFIMKTNASLEENLPMFGIYLVAGYKLLPALQAIANSYSSIKGNNSALINIKSDLNNILHNNKNTLIGKKKIQENFSNIELKNIYFSHKEKVIFKNLNFKINKSEVVGIMGETGSGKSTFIDIFCGLLSFKNGIYLYNEKEIHLNNKFGLENKVALVPQKINLLDDSIKNNIFFSKDENNEKLSYLKDICILNFVEEKNRNWNTIVGENGSKLSGGQIQRLGIARALFNEPAILILDEATSGLDKDTEKQLINNLLKFRPKLTLIIISHNKDLLKFCDRIYELEDYKLAQINQ